MRRGPKPKPRAPSTTSSDQASKPVVSDVTTDIRVDDALLAQILDDAQSDPLDIQTNTMKMLYAQSRDALRRMQQADGAQREYLFEKARKYALDACALAKEAAPYVHRKMPQALEVKDVTPEEQRRNAETVRQMEELIFASERGRRRAKPVANAVNAEIDMPDAASTDTKH